MAESADLTDRLRKEYCPPLDEPLFLAIASEVDPANPDQVHEFITTLDSLKLAALEQENTDFDPSGTGGLASAASDRASKSYSSPEEDSASYGVASNTTAFSELKWDDDTNVGSELEEMSHEQKEEYLKNMFTTMRPYDISFVLKKCKGVLCQAIDELLNLASLEEETRQFPNGQPLIPKSVDGFLGQENGGRGRKAKNKGQARTNESSRASSIASVPSDASNGRQNVWTNSAEDVEFIFSRTNLAKTSIKSAYHSNAASLSTTIRALATDSGASFSNLNEVDPLIQIKLVELKQDFQFVPGSQLFGLLHIARSDPSAAHELAEAMESSPEPMQNGQLGGIALYASHTPTHEATATSSPSPSRSTKVKFNDTRAIAVANRHAASDAYAQASAAYKRGKSDRLMNGAASYYADVGRKRAKAAKAYFAAAADAHVASQSTSRVLDLHGIGVADAVRIAQEKVSIWWESLGDAKYAPGSGGPARDGYRIITGVGRHSKDGAPKIGPAVSRMLVREGWKVEVGQGEAIVYGKARR